MPSDSPSNPNESENPWTTLASRTVYDNPWITVREDDVLRPDGRPGIYGVVHFKNAAVGVLPVEADGRIWMVGQYRYPLGRYSWEIPEGGGPAGEAPEETARRELAEETGLTCARLEFLFLSHLSNSVSDEVAHVYRATDLTPGRDRPEGTERLSIRLFTLEALLAMLRRGDVTDSMTVMALLYEAARRGIRV